MAVKDEIYDYISKSFLPESKKIDAIKYYRRQTGADLPTARKVIESMMDGTYVPVETTVVTAPAPAVSGEEEIARLKEHIRRNYYPTNSRTAATALYRSRTCSSLCEAKDAIEEIWSESFVLPVSLHPGNGLSLFREMDELYFYGTRIGNSCWPAPDIHGYAHLFTSVPPKSADNFLVCRASGQEFCDLLPTWAAYGLTSFCLHQSIIEQEIFTGEDFGFGPVWNSEFNLLLIRFLQFKVSNSEELQREAQRIWNEIAFGLNRRLFLVPVCYEGDDLDAPVNDTVLHLFPGAQTLLEYSRIIPAFEGLSYHDGNNRQVLHFRTIRNSKSHAEYLPCYTQFDEMQKFWNGQARYALATFEDMQKHVSLASGILINHATMQITLEPDLMKEISQIHETQKLQHWTDFYSDAYEMFKHESLDGFQDYTGVTWSTFPEKCDPAFAVCQYLHRYPEGTVNAHKMPTLLVIRDQAEYQKYAALPTTLIEQCTACNVHFVMRNEPGIFMDLVTHETWSLYLSTTCPGQADDAATYGVLGLKRFQWPH